MTVGSKSGGRIAGTPNTKKAEVLAKIVSSGLTPLEYMIGIMQDEEQDQRDRLDAAKSAAPYVHPKLANIEHGNLGNAPFVVKMLSSDDDL